VLRRPAEYHDIALYGLVDLQQPFAIGHCVGLHSERSGYLNPLGVMIAGMGKKCAHAMAGKKGREGVH